MDATQERLAAHRLHDALRRLHRREPLKPDHRADSVLAELRADPGERRPERHRGGGSLRGVSDAELLSVLDAMTASGALVRVGHRVRLPDHEPVIADPQMRDRVERLLQGLRDQGADAPRVTAIAARLGIPSGVIEELRAAGELVPLAEGVEYPRDLLAALMERLDAAAQHGPLTVARVRDILRASRRHAEALLAYRRASRGVGRRSTSRPGTHRDRRGVP